jgi:1,2-diacylglycerol 3-beta-galactosyltransferase
LGWQADRTTLLAVGSKRVDGLAEALHVVNHSGLPLQLAVVSGGDADLYHQFQEMEWHTITHLYNYINNMHELMSAADIILCKPGGLIVTEALACGRPMLLIGTLLGQEKGNAEYVVEGGAGELAQDPVAVLESLCHWMEHGGALLAQRSEAAARLGAPRAAYDIAQLAWQAAQHGPQHKRSRPMFSRQRLLGLFDSNKVKY